MTPSDYNLTYHAIASLLSQICLGDKSLEEETERVNLLLGFIDEIFPDASEDQFAIEYVIESAYKTARYNYTLNQTHDTPLEVAESPDFKLINYFCESTLLISLIP